MPSIAVEGLFRQRIGDGGLENGGHVQRMAYRNLDVLDAADRAAEAVNRLIDRNPRRLVNTSQLRNSAQAIGASISEAFGRRKGRDRDYRLEIARGEAEETIRHLCTNFRCDRITGRDYWPLHNLLVVIVRMLNSLLRR